MNYERFKRYVVEVTILIKELAGKAKKEADNPKEGFEDYSNGVVMGYYSIITLLKHQAFDSCLDQKVLGLADMEPDIDLLGLQRNPDVDFGEGNWSIDVMNEERVKGYFNDLIALLKKQAREAKSDADKPEKGFEDFNRGQLMAYHSVFTLMKQQAFLLNMDEKVLGLENIDPDIDLTSLR